ncbi:patatin-like phospholipase domain-containing protein 2 [Cheilinus undulatus]|uniref:patatin-like phospholipase domain-containing protein 2 n=1 Tax=Cheilinus undulatus TaxID=241271 RepID=UPI001BD2EB2F|nr:patatin-like phospholipase domain-containing protein 2 [Cheilinus undulatus]
MAPGISSCHYSEGPHSISFSGSGFLATYQLGVTQCFLNYAPWILSTAPCVLGASAGSLVAAAVVCEMSPVTIREEVLNFAKQMKSFTLGPLNPSINVLRWLESVLNKYLPPDAHQLANGRLAVAMTRMTDSKLTIMSKFYSKEDVVQALLCSCFVPGYCGLLPPSFHGEYYVDGGFRSMQPQSPVPCSSILTVSPFSGEVDICPSDAPSMWDMVVSGTTLKGNIANSFRILNALYPIALETLDEAFHSGYKDAFSFLLNNNLAKDSILNQVSQNEPRYYDQNKEWQQPEDNIEGEEEMKEGKGTSKQKPITENTHVTGSPVEPESTPNLPTKALRSDIVRNVLLSNMVTYLSMFGLPARILSHLFLPLMVSFYAVLQSRKRLELMFSQAPEFVFWLWHAVRHFTLFFYEIVIFSLKKNIHDRVMPTMLLLQWLKIQSRYENLTGEKHPTPGRKSPSSAHSDGMKRSPVL